jgi:hypothetical protein
MFTKKYQFSDFASFFHSFPSRLCFHARRPFSCLLQLMQGRIDMAFESLLHEIDAEISRLHQAKALLSGTNGHRGLGRPAKAATPAKTAATVKAASAKRTLSPQARKKNAAAQKKRWAKIWAAKG